MGTVLDPTFVPFQPSASAADSIFAAISSGSASPQELARQHNTTVEALVLWLDSDEAHTRLSALNAGLALYTRSVALTHLPAASHLLARIIDECRNRFREAGTAHAAINDRHLCRLSYIASSLLYRLARTPDRAPAPRAPRATDLALTTSGIPAAQAPAVSIAPPAHREPAMSVPSSASRATEIAPSVPVPSPAPSVIDDPVTEAAAPAAASVPGSAPRATEIAPSDPVPPPAPSVIDDPVTEAAAPAAISVPVSLDATTVTDAPAPSPEVPPDTVPLHERTTESLREEIKQSIAEVADPDSCADIFARIDQFDRATLIDMLEGAERYAANPDEPLAAPGPAP